MKKHKILFIMSILVLVILTFTACSSKNPEDSFNAYKKAWEESDYESMYNMLSKSSKEYIGKEEFIERYTNILKGIEAENIDIDIKEKKDDDEFIFFSLSMDTLAGRLEIDDYKIKMIKEKQDDKNDWFVEWDESLIFPKMTKEDKVKVRVLNAKRGEIFDRYGKGLAVNGKRNSVGIYPSQYDASSNKNLADLLDIDEKIISDKLEKNSNPEFFIPLVKLSIEDGEILNKLLSIKGIRFQEVEDRVYPGGEALGSLIGYIKPITAEQLEKDQEGVYHNRSLVGKFGLEEVYETRLRPKDGREIYISKIEEEKEIEQIVLVRTESEDGKDLNINIDIELQKKIYSEISGDIGASTAINPKTGEVLAMVSSPSFDSNLYTSYISDTQKKVWEEMEASPFINRFNKSYSPGSTFKILTGAIGLENGTINPQEKIIIEGKSWQKDSSWGNYNINRVSQRLSKVDLKDAFVYSDNIYFAMNALKIGEEDFLEASKKFGFDEELPIKYPFAKSQITNDGKIGSEILLADTGYGQGQVLMSPLHLSLVYSSLLNDGNIMEAKLEKDEEIKIWKENVIGDENRSILLSALISVIEDENGTARDAKLPNIKLAGKTGTAELKLSQDDKGKENGWFVAMDVDEAKLVISTLIENVEGRGGSHYIVPKVRNIMDYYLSK